MEAVAVPAMNFAFKSAAIAITDEIGLLSGVTEELFFLTKEYEMMQAVLRAASTENVKGEVMTTWILQVRELASDVDNCLQEASVLQMKKVNQLKTLKESCKKDKTTLDQKLKRELMEEL
ncbi:uncharacterized protein LOC144556399 isoform X3 [Carex rostrata]